MAQVNWRTINIDALDPDSAANFDLSTLTPGQVGASAADVQALAGQIRQLLRGGDSEGALRGALEMAPYGGDERAKVCVCASFALILFLGGGEGEHGARWEAHSWDSFWCCAFGLATFPCFGH